MKTGRPRIWRGTIANARSARQRRQRDLASLRRQAEAYDRKAEATSHPMKETRPMATENLIDAWQRAADALEATAEFVAGACEPDGAALPDDQDLLREAQLRLFATPAPGLRELLTKAELALGVKYDVFALDDGLAAGLDRLAASSDPAKVADAAIFGDLARLVGRSE